MQTKGDEMARGVGSAFVSRGLRIGAALPALVIALPLAAHAQPGAQPAPLSAPPVLRQTAICGPGDRPETGLQGETPLKDILSGRNKSPYFCGVRIIGSTTLEGGGSIMRRSQSCAYVSSSRGVWVIDMSDPTAPKPLKLLQDPGAVGSSESFNVLDAPDRHVMVAGKYSSALTSEQSPMSIYDVSDCKNPKLMSTFYWPGDTHVPSITPDGKTVFMSLPYGVAGVQALDISNLAQPKYIGHFPLLMPRGRQARCHDLSFNADNTRMYCPGSVPTEADREAEPGPSVWDISNITARKPFVWPPIRFVGEADVKGQGDHDAPLIAINGKPHLVAGGELGCAIGRTDFPTIFDISDEKNPRKVGEFRLEVMERCVADATFKPNQRVTYGLHYNSAVGDAFGSVPLGMFNFQSAGLRIVDLRDPTQPREVAYYHPEAPAEAAPAAPNGAPARPRYSGSCGSHSFFDKAKNQIWFSCSTGVYVAELTPAVKAFLGVPGQ